MQRLEDGINEADLGSGRRAVATALGGSMALAGGLGVGRFVYTPILPPMVEALSLSGSMAGLIASANFLGYLIGALAAAMPILPGSRRLWLLGALLASAVTTGAMGLTQSLAAFLVLRFAGGVASAFVLILASALVLEHLAEARRTSLSSLYFAGVGIGIAVSAILVAALLRAGGTWRSLWLASGVLSLLAALTAALLLQDSASSPQLARADGNARDANGRDLTRLVVAYGLFGFGYVITATFLVAIVRGTPAIRQWEPFVWTLFGVAAAPSVPLWTRIARSLGTPKTFAVACAVEAAGVAASVAWPSTLGVFCAAILVGGTLVSLTALGLVWARTLATSNSQRVLAFMTAAFGVGQIIGPGFAGVASDWSGGFAVPSIVAIAALLAAAVLAWK